MMIQIKDLHKSYHIGSNLFHVLKGINFDFKEDERLSIMRFSGFGGSLLLSIFGMSDGGDRGEYMLDNIPIKNGNEFDQVIQANTSNEGTAITSLADVKQMIFEGKIDESEVGEI
jgi:ABC-type lipoprotein export system ATPase subunit